jgi:hypothetical protein
MNISQLVHEKTLEIIKQTNDIIEYELKKVLEKHSLHMEDFVLNIRQSSLNKRKTIYTVSIDIHQFSIEHNYVKN